MKELGIILIILGAIAGVLISVIRQDNEEERAWLKFRIQNHCRIVGQKEETVSSSLATVVRPDGGISVAPVTTTTPSQTAWECADGVTYWRNN